MRYHALSSMSKAKPAGPRAPQPVTQTQFSRAGHSQPRFLPALLILFLASGCAGLIYEVVWFQLLQLVVGSSAVSLGVLLATYMGGLCLGSFALPRYLSRNVHPLRAYAQIEAGIGVLGYGKAKTSDCARNASTGRLRVLQYAV